MSDSIRMRVCLAVVDGDRILLVPHYRTDAGAVQWVVPGGRVDYSITISFSGSTSDGELRAEANHPYGEKVPRWFSAAEVKTVKYHPEKTVKRALGIHKEKVAIGTPLGPVPDRDRFGATTP